MFPFPGIFELKRVSLKSYAWYANAVSQSSQTTFIFFQIPFHKQAPPRSSSSHTGDDFSNLLLEKIEAIQGETLSFLSRLPLLFDYQHLWLQKKGFKTDTGTSASVQVSRSGVSDSLRPHGPQHARPPCPSPALRVHSDSRPSSWWCHPTISSSVVPFSSCLQSLLASGYFPISFINSPLPLR